MAPSCSIKSDGAKAVEAALSSACVSKVYHPDVEQGLGGKAPHLALWHEEGVWDLLAMRGRRDVGYRDSSGYDGDDS